MNNNNTILRIRDLTVIKRRERYLPMFLERKDGYQLGSGYLVNGMNISIRRNRIHGIVGESGSGKSLTVKSILGLIDFSPGIVQGDISYYSENGPIQVLPEDSFLRDIPKNIRENLSTFRRNTRFSRIQYFTLSDDEWLLELEKDPEINSIQIHSINLSTLQKRNVKFKPPTRLVPRLVKLEETVGQQELVAVSYSCLSTYSSNRLKKKIDRIQKVKEIRGENVTMILQDPQTFLNPYWNIEKQIRNLISRKKKVAGKTLITEKNFAIRIIGGADDFPVLMEYDRKSMQRYLQQAELWVNGVRYNLLAEDRLLPIEGNSLFWGIQTVGKIFFLEVHPISKDFPIVIKWDPSVLRTHVKKAIFSTNEADINLFSTRKIELTAANQSSDGIIRAKIELFAGSGDDFSFPIIMEHSNTKTELLIGWEEGATEQIDIHKGEGPVKENEKDFYTGFVIENDDSCERILSHVDIKAPDDIVIAEATLTVAPKYDQNYKGELIFKARGDGVKRKSIAFGLITNASDGVDESMGEVHKGRRVEEGYFDVGFVINDGDFNEVFSANDFRSTRIREGTEREILSLLSKVDLNDRDGRFRQLLPKEISGGQGQRVMISLAMASKPDLLIADEPSTGLDVTKQVEIVHLFQQYKEQGRTILLISHDLNFVSHLADEITIVYAGCDLEHLSHRHLITNDKLHPYTKRLVSILRSKSGKGFESIPGDVPDPYRQDINGCPFSPRCEEKKKISIDLGAHICQNIYPSLINTETGKVDSLESWERGDYQHLVRCWLYLKSDLCG